MDKYKDMHFILEPSNGFWGLADRNSEEELKRDLKKRRKPPKEYLGVQSIALNTTNRCNLDCIYCSAKNTRKDVRNMSPDIAKLAVQRALELEDPPKLIFHGSEPLLNMGTIKEAVRYGEIVSAIKGKELRFSIQTNLAALSPSKLDFIKEHQIGISTSLDGNEKTHNKNRPYIGGRGSYSSVKEGIEKVLEIQEGMCVVSVVTKNSVMFLEEMVEEFEQMGITELQFIPSVPCGEDDSFVPSNTDLLSSYLNVFDRIFDKVENGKQKIRVRNVMQYLSSIFFNTGIDSCRICTPSQHHPLLAVDTNGDIYPCDFFWDEKDMILGNILDNSFYSVLNSPKNPRSSSIEQSYCGNCDWGNLCGGGCLADRLYSTGKSRYCEVHKGVYDYLSENIPSLIEKGIIKKILLE